MKFLIMAIITATALLLPLSICLAAQSTDPPGNIRLLPGYSHKKLQGIDSLVGEISRPNGLVIKYDIGSMAGNYAKNSKGESEWFKEQTINGDAVEVAFKSDRTLVVSFAGVPANFFGAVKSEEDIVDFMLTIATYTVPKSNN